MRLNWWESMLSCSFVLVRHVGDVAERIASTTGPTYLIISLHPI